MPTDTTQIEVAPATAIDKAKDLIASYDLGDDTPAAPASPVPAAQTPPPAPAAPRDPETGKFTKAEPPTEKVEEHSRTLVRRAISVGMSDEEIDSTPVGKLEDLVWARHEAALHEARQSRQKEADAGSMKAMVPVEDEDILTFGEAEKDLADEFKKPLKEAFSRQAKEIKELKAQIERLTQSDNQRQAMSFAEQVDRHFEKHKAHLGEGRGLEMSPDDPYLARRKAVLLLCQADQRGTLAQKIDRAVKTLYGASTPAKADDAVPEPIQQRRKEWDGAALVKPTNRAGAEEPLGKERAIRAVREARQDMTANPNEATSEDDFL